MIVEAGGARVGVTALMGSRAWGCVGVEQRGEATLVDPLEAAQRISEQLKGGGLVDALVCLSHSGHDEDVALAQQPFFDVIFGGHDHIPGFDGLSMKRTVGGGETLVVHGDPHGYSVACAELEVSRAKGVHAVSSQLIQIAGQGEAKGGGAAAGAGGDVAAKLRDYISTVEASFKETLKEVLCVTTPELNLSTKVGRWVGRLVGEAPAVLSWPTPTLHQHPLRASNPSLPNPPTPSPTGGRRHASDVPRASPMREVNRGGVSAAVRRGHRYHELWR